MTRAQTVVFGSLDGDTTRRTILVTPRLNPDLDGVACAVAYSELLSCITVPALPFVGGRPDAEARLVIEWSGWTAPDVPSQVAGFVLVDASELRGLPPEIDPGRVVEVIDHRLHGQARDLFPNAKVQIEAVGAAATLIEERFVAAGIPPSPTVAIFLQGAIHSNTQCLKGLVTTPRDVAAAQRLGALHAMPTDLLRRQFEARGAEILADLRQAIARETKQFDDPDGCYEISQLELPGALDHIDAAVALLSGFAPRTALNLVDPTTARSALVVVDPGFRGWLTVRTGLVFDGIAAWTPGVLLRKQIVARIMEAAP